MITLREMRLMAVIQAMRAGEGNPHHKGEGPGGGQFTSGGGGGETSKGGKPLSKRGKARRARLRRRLKRMKREAKDTLRERRHEHATRVREHHQETAAGRRSLGREHKAEIRGQAREHASERKGVAKDQVKERDELIKEHKDFESRNKKRVEEVTHLHEHSAEHLKEKGYTHEQVKGAIDRWTEFGVTKKAEHKQALADLSKEHQEAHKDLKEQHEYSRAEMAKDHAKALKSHDRDAKKELGRITKSHEREIAHHRKTFRKQVETFAAKHKVKLVSKSEPRSFIQGIDRKLILSKGKIHKAGSAESILRHCLRHRGWTRDYYDGELTGSQHLELLEGIREYGRAWLRHEAEQFVRHYVNPSRAMGGEPEGLGGLLQDLPDRSDQRKAGGLVGELWDANQVSTENNIFSGDDVLSGTIDNSAVRAGDLHGHHDGHYLLLHGVERGSTSLDHVARADGDDGDSSIPTHLLLGHLSRFFRRTKQFVRETIVAGVMSLLGPAPLTGEDLETAEREAIKQDQYFDRFHEEVRTKGFRIPVPTGGAGPGPEPPIDIGLPAFEKPLVIDIGQLGMTTSQFVARVESYGSSSWQSSINAGRGTAIKDGVFAKERRVHRLAEDAHRYCKTCIDQSRLGWQPLGTLLEIGDSECNGNCDCYYEWMDYEKRIFVAPGGRHNPKSLNQPVGPNLKLPGIAYPPEEGAVLPDDDGVHMIAEPPGVTIQVPIAGPPKR